MSDTWHLYEEGDFTPEEFDVIAEADSCYCLRQMQDFCLCSREAKEEFAEAQKRIGARTDHFTETMPLASMLELMREGRDCSKGVNEWQG
jgi:hypothetical protein